MVPFGWLTPSSQVLLHSLMIQYVGIGSHIPMLCLMPVCIADSVIISAKLGHSHV